MKYLPAVCITVGIAIMSLTESSYMPSVSLNDKVLHGAMYTLLTLTWIVPLRKLSTFNFQLSTCIIAGVTLYGALLELLQHYCTLTRSGEWLDLLADFVGALIGTMIVFIFEILRPRNLDKK